MRFKLFGKHLHNQIVLPLIVALIIVGVVGSAVAITLLGQVIQRWIDEDVTAVSSTLSARFEDEAQQMQRAAKLVAQNPGFAQAIARGDQPATAAGLVGAYESLKSTQTGGQTHDVTNLMLLDDSGRVLGAAGGLGVMAGQQPFDDQVRSAVALSANRPVLLTIGDKSTITAFEPVSGPRGRVYWLAYSVAMDDGFVSSMATNVQQGVALYDADLSPAGMLVSSATSATLLETSLRRVTGHVAAVLKRAQRANGTLVTDRLTLKGVDYRIAAEQIALPGDVAGGKLYLVTVLNGGIAEQMRATTAGFIIVWSLLAVIALVLLDLRVAHRVSDPLAELSDSVRKVAEGDFSGRVSFSGENEISELSTDFNRMIDALHERGNSVTKKVLELATLYEMSRSLGSTLDLDTLLDSVLDSALRIFNVEIGYVTLRDPETGELEMRASRGGAALSRSALRSSMCDWVVREGRPLIFNPVGEGEAERREPMSGAQAALCVPLISSEGTVGAITVGSRDAEHRFTSDDVRLLATVANQVTIAVGNIGLFSSLQEAYLATVRALAAAVDAKDPYTRGHSDQVARLSLVIADAMGLSGEQRTALEMAAYLHDIGKIGISEEILLKPGRLTDEEMAQMRHHPLIGASILHPVTFPWPITPLVRHHHEHFDGSGYPAGLRGEEIPLLARVLTVADAFEAMIADRPYRHGRSREQAILELRRCSGTQFDPKIADAFIGVLERETADRPCVSDPDAESPDRDEMLAVLVAVCDGMMLRFRHLGGPRLSSNLERDLNETFARTGMHYLVTGGRLVLEDETHGGVADSAELRSVMRIIAVAMERTSGSGLVEHFRADAVAALPERMRALAAKMRLLAED